MSNPVVSLHVGDCLDLLPAVPSGSVDAIITDPPYAYVDRSYGEFDEDAWWQLMMGVCEQARRVLKPRGSAMFILQPNMAKAGSMRGWLWRFMAWAATEWNVIQDAYWWNFSMLPVGQAYAGYLRGSVKYCVWCGPADCYRNQDAVLWTPTDATKAVRQGSRVVRKSLSVHGVNEARMQEAVLRRGGSTPHNILPIPHVGSDEPFRHRIFAHGARTPFKVADWWVRYIVPPGGTLLDPFLGTGTIPLAAHLRGANVIGFDREALYVDIALDRINQARLLSDAEGVA